MKFVAAHRERVRGGAVVRGDGLPVSTFYDAVGRPPSTRALADAELAERIEKIWADSGRSYGSPRVHAALARGGVQVGRKRVERIMAGTVGGALICAAAGRPPPAGCADGDPGTGSG